MSTYNLRNKENISEDLIEQDNIQHEDSGPTGETEQPIEISDTDKQEERMDLKMLLAFMTSKFDEQNQKFEQINQTLLQFNIDHKKKLEMINDKMEKQKSDLRNEFVQEIKSMESDVYLKLEECEDKIRSQETQVNIKIELIEKNLLQGLECMQWGKHEIEVKFEAKQDESPLMYLKNLENHMENIHDQKRKLQIVRKTLKGNAELWFCLVQDQCTTYDEFKTLFIDQYWSETQQNIIRDEFSKIKYSKNYNINREIFIMQKHKIAQFLTPTISEPAMVIYLARMLETHIFENIVLQNIQTMKDLYVYLRRYDAYKKYDNPQNYNSRPNTIQNQQNNNYPGTFNYNNKFANNNYRANNPDTYRHYNRNNRYQNQGYRNNNYNNDQPRTTYNNQENNNQNHNNTFRQGRECRLNQVSSENSTQDSSNANKYNNNSDNQERRDEYNSQQNQNSPSIHFL